VPARPDLSVDGASSPSGHASRASSSRPVPAARSPRSIFSDDLPKASLLQLLLDPQAEGLNQLCVTRNVAEILHFRLQKPQSSPQYRPGIIGSFG